MAIIGGIFPFTAKVDATVWNRIYEKLSPSPIPKCNPIPPFVFLEESYNDRHVPPWAIKLILGPEDIQMGGLDHEH